MATEKVYHNLDFNNVGRLISVLDPINPQDVATKHYVDTQMIGTYRHLTAATTTTVKAGSGTLFRIVFNLKVAGTVTVFDSLSGSGTVIAVITNPGNMAVEYGLAFTVGLTVVMSAVNDVTVVYS